MKSTLHGPQRNLCGKQIHIIRTGKYDNKHPKLTQSELTARLLNMGVKLERSGISRIESGQRLLNDVEIYHIAKALNVPIEALFESAEDAKIF